MIKPFEFYFDFASPYTFLAHKKIRRIENENSIKINYMTIFWGQDRLEFVLYEAKKQN